MSHAVFSGVITAIVTPFDKKNQIDLDAFKNLLKMQKKAGIHGVVVAGTTGESPTLSAVERENLVRAALDEQTDEFSVYVGTGSNDTHETIEASKFYASLVHNGKSVRGVMAVVPYYNKPNPAGLKAHFCAVANAIPQTPFCIYNVPGRTVTHLPVSTFVEIAEACPNVVAIKEAAGDVRIVTELRNALEHSKASQRNIRILSGDDPTYAPALLCGAHGVISVTSHIIPRTMLAILKAAQNNQFEKVSLLHRASYPIQSKLFCAPNPVPLKHVLAKMGVCENTLRLPLVALEQNEIKVVESAIEEAKKMGVEIEGDVR